MNRMEMKKNSNMRFKYQTKKNRPKERQQAELTAVYSRQNSLNFHFTEIFVIKDFKQYLD